MGATFASDLSELKGDIGLITHLQCNHYPPLPSSLLEPAKKAIELCSMGCGDEMVDLPSPIEWRGQSQAPAYECANAWHLWAWIESEE